MSLRIVGRGDSRLGIPDNIPKAILRRIFEKSPVRFTWDEVLKLSGYKRLPAKTSSFFQNRVLSLRSKGYRTVSDICAATGIPKTTFHRWEGSKFPKMPEVDGVKAVTEDEFEEFVERVSGTRN